MADRTQAEIRDIVQDVRKPFQELVVRQKKMDEVLRGTIAKWIEDNLPEELTPKVAVVDRKLSHAVTKLKNNLRRPYEIYVEPHSQVKRDETCADNLEDLGANWQLRRDPNGWLIDDINFGLACKPFAASRLSHSEWKLPNQSGTLTAAQIEENRRYRQDWFDWQDEILPYDTVAFTEKLRVVTMSVLHYRLPVFEIVKRFGDYKAENTPGMPGGNPNLWVEVYRGQFEGTLRSGSIESKYDPANPTWNKTFECMVVDDGANETYYIAKDPLGPRGGGYGKGDNWAEVKSTPNLLGRPSVFLCFGTYNTHEPIPYRYESKLASLASNEKNIANILSLWASKAMRMPHETATLPPEVAVIRAADGGGALVPDHITTEPNRINYLLGKRDNPTLQVDPTTVELFKELKERGLSYMPSNVLGDSDFLTTATAAAYVGTEEAVERDNEECVKSVAAQYRDKFEAMLHFYTKGPNAHRKKGDVGTTADEALYAVNTGNEYVHGRAPVAGKQIEITPQMLESFNYSIKVIPVQTSATARAARLSEAIQVEATGFGLYDEVLEAKGVTNKTQWRKDKAKEELLKLDGTTAIEGARARRVQWMASFTQQPAEAILQLAGMGVPQPAQTGGVQPTDAGKTTSGNFTQAPSVQGAVMGAGGNR